MQLNIGSSDDIFTPNQKNRSTRIYIGLGKQDKLQVSDFVKLLLERTTLTNRDINNIDMHDNFTFFDIPAHLVDEVAMAFIKDEKGRKIIVEEVREKKGSSRRKTNKDNQEQYKKEIKTVHNIKISKEKTNKSSKKNYNNPKTQQKRSSRKVNKKPAL